MSGECTVTPGTSWSSDPITDAKLNQAANPVVRVNEDAIGARELHIEEVAPLIIGGTVLTNWFRNPGFVALQTGAAASLTPGARRNTAAAGWWHQATGKDPLPTIEGSTAVDGSTRELRLTAAASPNCEWFVGQSIGDTDGDALYNRTVTIEVDVRNLTSQTVQPKLQVKTWSARNDATTGTQVYLATATGAVNTVVAGATQRFSWTLTLNNTVDPRNGFDVAFVVAMTTQLDSREIAFRRASFTVSGGPVTWGAAVPRGLTRDHFAAAEPTVSDDILKGWMQGDIWRRGLTALYLCVSNATGAAQWREITGIRRVINRWVASSTASTQTTSVIPLDNTIPQNTEGTQIFSLTVSPSSTSNWLEFAISGVVDLSASGYVSIAVFRDSVANAVYATFTSMDAAARGRALTLTFEIPVPSLDAQTYTVRIGPSTGTASWLRSNGGDVFGGVCQGALIIREVTRTA